MSHRKRRSGRTPGRRSYVAPPPGKRKSYPSRVGTTVDLAGQCQACTSRGNRCSRPASVQLGALSLCEQHASIDHAAPLRRDRAPLTPELENRTTKRESKTRPCPFCDRIASGQIAAQNELSVAIPDAYPVTPGHALVVPRRHVTEFFSLTESEQAAVWRLVAVVRRNLLETRKPDGFNVGLNAGAAGGQTVPHAHVHVIPRYAGDSADPRGGVRHVIPGKARYTKEPP